MRRRMPSDEELEQKYGHLYREQRRLFAPYTFPVICTEQDKEKLKFKDIKTSFLDLLFVIKEVIRGLFKSNGK